MSERYDLIFFELSSFLSFSSSSSIVVLRAKNQPNSERHETYLLTYLKRQVWVRLVLRRCRELTDRLTSSPLILDAASCRPLIIIALIIINYHCQVVLASQPRRLDRRMQPPFS